MPSLFIAFEGGDGAGKTTQSSLLETALCERGYSTVSVREPGSTTLGNYLRQYLVNEPPVSPLAELFLFEASRAELMREVIEPQLAAGAVVIADRFAGSTVAYQGYGRGLNLERIEWLNDVATGGRFPDLTVLLDIDPSIGLGRVHGRQLELGLQYGEESDRFEDQQPDFHHNVRYGFQQQAAANQGCWVLVEANQSIETVAAQVWCAVETKLGLHSSQE